MNPIDSNRSRKPRATKPTAQKTALRITPPAAADTDTPRSKSRIRIGPAGWSYPDWAGYVYPSRRNKAFHEAAYLAQFFDTIEINTSFYYPVQPEHAAQWVERVAVNPNFMFTAKLWQRFTHEAVPTTEALSVSAPTLDDERAVRAGFDVLRAAGKLGAVLLQFPFSCHRTSETTAHLAALLRRFSDYPLVVEVRHASWQTPETLDLLHKFKAGFCNIDQPIIGRSTQPSAEVTSPTGYVRLHGRRYDTWFSDDEAVPSHERYNYLYSAEELTPWAKRIAQVSEHSRDVYVITNNHYQGKAVVNALELIAILKQSKVKVPEPLREHFPELNNIADTPAAAPSLFPLGRPEDR